MVGQSIWGRLSYQLDAVASILADAPENAITESGNDGAWSGHDHIAHLARMHEIMLDRLRRIVKEDAADLSEYEAETDPEWPPWSALPTREMLTRLQALRGELVAVVRGLSETQLRREAVHPKLGALAVTGWLEAFCLHEAHHLHVAWERVAEGKRAAVSGSPRTE